MSRIPLDSLLKIDPLDLLMGSTPLPTTSQTVTGAVDELKSDLDSYIATATVSNNTITFTDINDTVTSGYEIYIDITSASTNKSPYAKLTTITGSGTSSMTLVYETNADNGATAKLRRVK